MVSGNTVSGPLPSGSGETGPLTLPPPSLRTGLLADGVGVDVVVSCAWLLTAPMILLGAEPVCLWLLIAALFGGFFAHITAVVAATVTATSEIPDAHKGLATGLVTTSQRVAVTVGIPSRAGLGRQGR
jgi:hypothetical protein